MVAEAANPISRIESSIRVSTLQALTLMIVILTGVITTGLVYLVFTDPSWQYMVLSILYVLATLFGLVAYFYLIPEKRLHLTLSGINFTFAFTLLTSSALISNIGLPLAIVYLVYSLILSSAMINDRNANLTIVLGLLVAVVCSLLTEFTPVFITKVTSPLVDIVTPAFLGVLFMIYVVMLAMQFVATTMRIRMVTAFIAIVIIPLTILSLIQSRLTYDVLRDENNRSLMLAAQQTAHQIDNFIAQSRAHLTEAANFDVFDRYLALKPEDRPNSPEEAEMKLTLQILDLGEFSDNVYLASYGLLDITGLNVYDTQSDRVISRLTDEAERNLTNPDMVTKGKGSLEGDQDYFTIPARSGVSYASPLQVEGRTTAYLYVSTPIKNAQGQITGVLRIRYEGLLLQNLLKSMNGLVGPDSYTMLLDENGIRLADTFTPNYLYKSIAPIPLSKLAVLQENARIPILPESVISTNFPEFEKIVKNSENEPYFSTEISSTRKNIPLPEVGAIWSLSEMPWKVVYLEEDFDTAALRKTQRELTVVITTLIAGLVGLIGVGLSQVLSGPISKLTQTATQISNGDLEAQAPAHTSDEFGMLGNAFNLMTTQMRSLIGELEDRVKARTQEIADQNEALSTRARQLETISDVARQVVSMQELETLLSSVTRLISERFGFYHVGVFLLDNGKENAVLRAANSEGGQRMLARRHSLPVGKVGIVGNVTGSCKARIATDVGEDATYFNNPDLPQTRSEMALPLLVGQQVIGALDIQSTESNAFTDEDVEIFNTLADEVAIAIYNNQLYAETLQALTESQNLHRQYLANEWNQDLAIRRIRGYLYNHTGVNPQNVELPTWDTVIRTGKPVVERQTGGNGTEEQTALVVPIIIRGEAVGVVHVQDHGEDRIWTEDEMAVVNNVTGQVAVALENARLFENTVRRADREKKVLEITAHIRSSNNPEQMMQIAVAELQQALGATRAQIYVRQREQGDAEKPAPTTGNGNNGHH